VCVGNDVDMLSQWCDDAPMRRTLHIIVSCTERKRVPVPVELRLRLVAHVNVAVRADRWYRRLSAHTSPTVPATDLYGGDHWSVAKSLPHVAAANGFWSHLWVASAGYGLVPADAPLRSYSATFVGGHPDSVVSSTDGVAHSDFSRRWWARLSGMTGPVRKAPRTIADIVRNDPRAYLVVVGSQDYVAAMEADLINAVDQASNPDRIIVISTPGRFTAGSLAHHLIPSDARLQRRLGGARTSLHVRVARKILAEAHEWDLSAELLRTHYKRVLAGSAEAPTFDRTRLSDEEVGRFIRSELDRSPDISCTQALRVLRGGGCACEQSRFKMIFHRVQKVHHAS
jgi:hypothetical protein